MNLKERAVQIMKDIPMIFLALKRKDTPIAAKIMAGITIGYALSPIDFIPDFIPVIGYLDDIILLPLLVGITIKLIPKEIIQECRMEVENNLQDNKLKKWYYSIPIILFWILVVGCIVYGIGKGSHII